MTTATDRKFAVGDSVIIAAHQVGAYWALDKVAVIESLTPASPFCGLCHCDPIDPDHTDGSICCPGPYYVVEVNWSECRHVHHEVYAEHELRPVDLTAVPAPNAEDRCRNCGEHIRLFPDEATEAGSVWIHDLTGAVSCMTGAYAV